MAEAADARVQVQFVVVAEKKRAANVRYHDYQGGLVRWVRVRNLRLFMGAGGDCDSFRAAVATEEGIAVDKAREMRGICI